jgi:sugar lactone lactonase YvrE
VPATPTRSELRDAFDFRPAQPPAATPAPPPAPGASRAPLAFAAGLCGMFVLAVVAVVLAATHQGKKSARPGTNDDHGQRAETPPPKPKLVPDEEKKPEQARLDKPVILPPEIEDKKPEDKKPEDRKNDAKPEDRKPDQPQVVKNDPPAEEKKPDFKPEDRKPDEKKPEDDRPQVKPGALVVKKRNGLSEEELFKLLKRAPEVALDRTAQRTESVAMVVAAKQAQGKLTDGAPAVMKQRADLAGLPFRMGEACKITPSAADHLQGGSINLRAYMSAGAAAVASRRGLAVTGDTRPDPQALAVSLNSADERRNTWLQPEAVPALQQLLMAENESIRKVLVDQLARIQGPKASAALAQRAVFDLNPEVRQAALEALRERPRAEFRQVFLDALLYPWSAVSDHAAEALVALDMKESVPALLALLDAPDPNLPFERPGAAGPVIREVVRINHLHNCLMCHAPSFSRDDKVRGKVPDTNQPLPPAFTRQYYEANDGVFVRADVTYLQQDFSVPMPVDSPGLWPTAQRYDFMVRLRLATPEEVKLKTQVADKGVVTEHQRAMTFALRELTGKDPGPTPEDWKRLFLKRETAAKLTGGLKGGAGVAAGPDGYVFVADAAEGTLLRARKDEATPLLKGRVFEGLALDARGRLLACQPAAGRIVAIDADGGEKVLFDTATAKRALEPLHLVADRKGGVYFTSKECAESRTGGASVNYLSAQGTLTRLPLDLKKPRGLGLSPDEKTLYISQADSLEVYAVTLESAGSPSRARVLCRLDASPGESVVGGAGLAVDAAGNVFLAHPAKKAVQVVNPEGARLGLIALPEAPTACAVGGEGGKALFVATASGVFSVKIGAADLR